MNDESHPFIHETAVVDDGVEIGGGSKIWHFCHILPGSRIGRNCVLGQNVMVGPNVSLRKEERAIKRGQRGRRGVWRGKGGRQAERSSLIVGGRCP